MKIGGFTFLIIEPGVARLDLIEGYRCLEGFDAGKAAVVLEFLHGHILFHHEYDVCIVNGVSGQDALDKLNPEQASSKHDLLFSQIRSGLLKDLLANQVDEFEPYKVSVFTLFLFDEFKVKEIELLATYQKIDHIDV